MNTLTLPFPEPAGLQMVELADDELANTMGGDGGVFTVLGTAVVIGGTVAVGFIAAAAVGYLIWRACD